MTDEAATDGRRAMQPREPDEEEIRDVATAYLESWLDGDGERMRGSLHPERPILTPA